MRSLLVLAFVACLGAAGCAAPTGPAAVHHLVFIDVAEDDRAALEADCAELIDVIPHIDAGWVGPRFDAGRDAPGIDTSFVVGFYTRFAAAEAYEAYLSHPAHLALLERWGPRLRSVRICDVGRGELPRSR